MSDAPDPSQPDNMSFPGFGPMFESLEAINQTWRTLHANSPFRPTLDVRELDERIQELRTVERWLALNLDMLRNTLQTMEMQRGTLQAFNDLSASLNPSPPPPRQPGTAAAPTAGATQAAPRAAAPAAPDVPGAESNPAGAADTKAMPGDGDAPGSASNRTDAPDAAAMDAGAQISQAWWQMMQQQLSQLADIANAPWPTPASGVAPAHTAGTDESGTQAPPAAQPEPHPAPASTSGSSPPPTAGPPTPSRSRSRRGGPSPSPR
ncbi:MAG: hypothetical protein Q4A16_00785 [Lautropia sp.]|nr:hypothetical protein [Lautropia sp.]